MTTFHPHSARVRRTLALIALTSLTALSACHRNRTTSGVDPDAAEEASTIEFRNESLAQADVFISAASVGARRIGTVFAGRTETLTIPRELAARGSINIVSFVFSFKGCGGIFYILGLFKMISGCLFW